MPCGRCAAGALDITPRDLETVPETVLPNIKSAKKDMRKSRVATIRNRANRSALRTALKRASDAEATDEQRRQLLGAIGRSADRMQQLLTELLDLARLRAGAIEMARDRFDARELARDVAVAVEPMAAARQQLIRLALPDTAVPVEGDRRRLEQALLNLVTNAQKFSRAGADVTIEVRGDGGRASWTVVDEGPGIGPEAKARLFERFFVGASDRRGGTGIGLPTALAIAQAHDGTIEVESELGQGSTFRLIVPLGGADR